MPVSHAALVEQLVAVVRQRLLDPLEILLGIDQPTDRVRAAAEEWAARLLGADQAAAVGCVARLIAALYPGDHFAPPAGWWGTPFGRVVALRAGYPGVDHVSYSVAGAMLGVTRQGVHDLVTRGKLDRHPDGGVTTESIGNRMRSLL
ncbi:hypothetical protein V5P93_005017 [Actinokineospora auranticolor]|uniref:MftR C-terminal domain-containing protein n=1 Tax=Actinokineospora auranticolor TaxID=155976 RepID=A0A2S6GK11_9PSEU|nr:hypothetical protein [Actinokineospora auranticolor]PPK65545.1 hypothetical protein CLV40_11329 [Actinokineospora auranticolor]